MNNFTRPAQKLWDQIPPKARLKILNTVWCAGCRDTVTILSIKGRVAGGELLLQGTCDKCGLKIVRLVENECA